MQRWQGVAEIGGMSRKAILVAAAKLLNAGLFSDVTLVCGEEEIRAHKAILAARSPVFKAMFAHKMSEALEGKAVIEDIRAEVLHEVLRWEGRTLIVAHSSHQVHLHWRSSDQWSSRLAQSARGCRSLPDVRFDGHLRVSPH